MSPFSVSLTEVAGPQKVLYKHATWYLMRIKTMPFQHNSYISLSLANIPFRPELISISWDLSHTVIFVWGEGKGVSLSSVFGWCSGRGVGFWGQFSALNCPQKKFCVGCTKGTGRVFTKGPKSSRRRVYRGRAPSYLPPAAKGGVRTTIEGATSLIGHPVQNMHTRPKPNAENRQR